MHEDKFQVTEDTGAPVAIAPPGHSHALQYFPAVDGLRGLLSLGVLFFHVQASWLPSGPVLIDCFFVISGFLITLLLRKNIQRSGSPQLGRFWKRRLIRLYPAMLVMVLTYLIASLFLVDAARASIADAIASLLYFSNLTKLYHYVYPTIFGHTWSLSVEEQFYIVWPLAFAASVKARLSSKGMLLFLSLVILAAMAWRWRLIETGAPWSRLYYSFETRMDAFVIGGMTAIAWQGWVSKWAYSAWLHYAVNSCAVALAALLTIARPLEIHYFVWQQSAFLLLTAGTILLLTSPRTSWLSRLLCAPRLVALGVRSYGIYLWHWPLIWLLHASTGLAGWTMLLVVLPFTLLLAAISYRYIERPILQRRVYYATASPG